MHPLKSNRVAWSVAIASLALWVTSAPVSWGAVSLFGQSADNGANAPGNDVLQLGDTTVVNIDGDAPSAQCPTVPPAIATLIPPTATTGAVTPAGSAGAGQQGTFHVCGSDPQTAQAIEQLIAGNGFSATLSARGDGCADLGIRVNPGIGNGSSSTNLSVSLGAGRNLVVQITSEQGATHVNIVER
jgi:hypothetical protein